MKTIKLLAALAIPAMFAACTNEEIVTNSPQQMKEVVGAELVGTNISLNVTNGDDAQSRMTAGGQFTLTDVLGLAWVSTASTPDAVQSENEEPKNSRVYANHRFAVNEDGKFSTWSNVYRGWHFAYYPYEYMEQAGLKYVDLNPAQTSKVWADRLSQNLHISARAFLTKDDLNEDNSLNSNYTMYNAVSNLIVNTTPCKESEFVEGGELDNLTIQYVKITTGQEIFADSAVIRGRYLPADSVENLEKKLLASFYANDASKSVVGINSFIKDNILTDVADAGFLVSEKANLVTIVTPTTATLDSTQIVIEVGVAGGKFVVKYDEEAAAGSNAATNNNAICKLKAAYAGKLTGKENLTVANTWPVLNVILYGDIFEADFGHISDLDEWKDAVALCEALGRTEQEFGIDGIISFNGGEIPMPEGCAVTVIESADAAEDVALSIDKNLATWPAGLTSEVNVVNNKKIADAAGINGNTVINNGTMTMKSDTVCNLVNKGTVTLYKGSMAKGADNSEGRIVVRYGAFVELAQDTESGEIAYAVAKTEYAYRINNLIGVTTGQSNFANVNTLIINEGVELKLNMKDAAGAGNSDPYNPTTGSAAIGLASLKNINIEMNGGTLTTGEGAACDSVAHVSVLAGNNTITDVVPVSVTVGENGTLAVTSTAEDNTLNWGETAIVNNGSFIASAYMHVASVVNNGTITATGYYVHSAADPVLNDAGTVKGKVIKCDGTPEIAAEWADKLTTAIAAYNKEQNGNWVITNYERLIRDLEANYGASLKQVFDECCEYYGIDVEQGYDEEIIKAIESALNITFFE